MRARLTLLTVICSLFLGGVVSAEEVVLRPKYQKGDKKTYQVETNIAQTLSIAGMNIETGVSVNEERVMEVTEVSEQETKLKLHTPRMSFTLNLPGGITETFDSGNPDQEPSIPQLADLFTLLRVISKATTTANLDGAGDLKEIELTGKGLDTLPESIKDMFTEERLQEQLKQEFERVGVDAVKPGETWTRSEVFDAGQGQYFTYTTTYKYAGRVEENGTTYDKVTATYAEPKFDIGAGSPLPLSVKSSDLSMDESASTILSAINRGGTVKQTSKMVYKGKIVFTDPNGNEVPAELDLTVTNQLSRQ